MYIIITQNQCNFCDKAKAILDGVKIPYVVYNTSSQSSAWVKTLLKMTNLTTVPQVFMSDGTHIGGYEELSMLLSNVDLYQ